jgi:CO/xanthine dehydrogenase Mo-binding subunit
MNAKMSDRMRTIGKGEVRKDGREKVTGGACYTADVPIPGEAHGALVRSPYHHARIIGIDPKLAERAPDVIKVLTAQDIPGNLLFGYLGVLDQPALASQVVRHLGEPVALVIARSRSAARAALRLVRVEYEVLEPVFDPEQAALPDAPRVHAGGNVLAEFAIQDGDLETGFDQAQLVLEEDFSTPRVAPSYLEVENAAACWNEDGSLTVWVSSQHPFLDQAQIASVLGLSPDRVRVKSAFVGGAFGGKEDSSLAILAALGAWSIQGAVRLINTRQESFLAHPKRHPVKFHYRVGVKKDGTLLALDAQAYLDTGAYASYGPAVGSLLTEMMAGSYRVPNVRLRTRVVYTNGPICGAMRGFGSPQAHFAIESLIDLLAARLGLDPLEVRLKNMLIPGDRLSTGAVIDGTAASLPQLLAQAEAARRKLMAIPPAPGQRSGVGMALGMQSMGLGAKVLDESTQRLVWQPDGVVALYLGSPDLGQGLASVSEQIAAEALELPYDRIRTVPLDTAVSPNGNVVCASRMTYLSGNALLAAAGELKSHLLDAAADLLGLPRQGLAYADGAIITPTGDRIGAVEILSRAAEDGREIVGEATARFPYPEERMPQQLPVGMPHGMFCFGCQVARVEVDPELGTVRVTHLAAIHDVGRAINRSGVEGQIEGGVSMGVGFALTERMSLKADGTWVDRFSEYLLPTARDMPARLDTVILEIPEASGPFGAKGIGEVSVVPTAPAIANAVYQAVGVRVRSLPIAPEVLSAALLGT